MVVMRRILAGLSGAVAVIALSATGALAQRTEAANITINNRGSDTIINLFVTPTTDASWGDDRLGSETLEAGGRFQFQLRTGACRHDVRATRDGMAEELRLNVDLCANRTITLNEASNVDASLPRREGGLVFFRVRNDADGGVATLTVTRAGQGGAGVDILGASTLESEQVFTGRVRRDQACNYDVVFGHEGGPTRFNNLNLCTIGRFAFDGTNQLKAFDNEARILATGVGPGSQTQTARPAAPSADGPAVDFTIINRSRTAINVINARIAGARTWGEDLLGADTLAGGAERTFQVARGTCAHEVRITWAGGAEEVRTAQNLCTTPQIEYASPPQQAGQGERKATPRAGGTPAVVRSEVVIVNQSSLAIANVYISSSRIDDWGDSRLQNDTIPPGGRRAITIERDGQCDFDIMVSFAGGREERRMRQNICRPREFAFGGRNSQQRIVEGDGPADGRAFAFLNDGRSEVMELYATPTNDTHWGIDRLGSDTLPMRARFELRLPQNVCQYDLRIVYRGGQRDERRNVDLCNRDSYSIGRQTPGTSLVSTGTGFYISERGHVLTNNHVIDGCSSVAIFRDGRRTPLQLVAADEASDLALLVEAGATTPALSLRSDGPSPMRAGERVVLIGFPVRQQLGGYNVTEGLISTLRGPRGDASLFQYTAPTQPGNSGGPVFDETGLVVGVVVAQLDKIGEDRRAQNINFGINLQTVRTFLGRQNIQTTDEAPGATLRPADLLERNLKSVLAIDCLG
jgi:S1-C subfamily serine protease